MASKKGMKRMSSQQKEKAKARADKAKARKEKEKLAAIAQKEAQRARRQEEKVPKIVIEPKEAQQSRTFQQQILQIREAILDAVLQQHSLASQLQRIVNQRREWWIVMCEKYRLNTYNKYTVNEEDVLELVGTGELATPPRNVVMPDKVPGNGEEEGEGDQQEEV